MAAETATAKALSLEGTKTPEETRERRHRGCGAGKLEGTQAQARSPVCGAEGWASLCGGETPGGVSRSVTSGNSLDCAAATMEAGRPAST